ncbi:MAG: permease [Solirubrobacterales bacterium]|nr:permease [Solirubrobacterales bacterium]
MPNSGVKYMLGDVDGAIQPAEERLRRTLEELRGAGIAAEGEVGDSDPLLAIQDEVLKFHPDQIIVVAHQDSDGAFPEKGLLEQAERDLEMPVTELVVDKAAEPHVLDVEHTQAGAGRKRGWRPSGNWPPLSARDVFGIVVAVIGTLLLGVLATKAVGDANGHDLEEGRLGGAAAATVLIATGMALLNLAHVVGLFLFQSVGYEGMWSRFLARISLLGTPVALVAAVILISI